jgi:hypothetical protein
LIGKNGYRRYGDVPLEYTCELKYDGHPSVSLMKWNIKEPLQEEMDFRAMMLPVISKQSSRFRYN